MCGLPTGSLAEDPPLGLRTEFLLCLSQTLCTKATMQTVRAADTNEVVKLIFRESDNDRKVSSPVMVGAWCAAGCLWPSLSWALLHLR